MAAPTIAGHGALVAQYQPASSSIFPSDASALTRPFSAVASVSHLRAISGLAPVRTVKYHPGRGRRVGGPNRSSQQTVPN